jgi:hypothetical protein
MSESGYQEIDLDNPSKAAAALEASDIEIVEEPAAESPPEAVPAPAPAAASTPSEDDESDDESPSDSSSSDRKKLTRSQRLKNQRDIYARQLSETQARLADAENRARRYEADANEGAAIGFDLYAKQLDTAMQALRRDFDQAFDAGDREKIFDVQQRMAQITAERAQVERDRRAIPTKPVQQSGPAAQPQTPQTQPQQPRRQPSPVAMEWYNRNKSWFNKDVVMTAGARVIDNQMVRDGYTPEDPDYFEELDRRLQREFPHKLGQQASAPARQPANNPTIQNRSTPAAAPGKVRVTITQADRDMANHLGISVEQYAREKAKTERAAQTVSQYTEIL